MFGSEHDEFATPNAAHEHAIDRFVWRADSPIAKW